MKISEDIEKFKKYLKALDGSKLIELQEKLENWNPEYEIKNDLINGEIEDRTRKLTKQLQRANCELALLKANIFYPVNEN